MIHKKIGPVLGVVLAALSFIGLCSAQLSGGLQFPGPGLRSGSYTVNYLVVSGGGGGGFGYGGGGGGCGDVRTGSFLVTAAASITVGASGAINSGSGGASSISGVVTGVGGGG